MALTGAQEQTIYEVCGLRAGGGDYTLVRFDTYSVTDITQSSLTWDYSSVKTAIDTRIAALDSDEEARLGTYIATYDDNVTSSFKMSGEVVLDAAEERELAKWKIVDIIGIQVDRVDIIENARAKLSQTSRGGRVTR